MRIALLVGGAPPNPTTGGGAVTAWTTMNHLLELGHDVGVVVLADAAHADPHDRAYVERESIVRERGASIATIASRAPEAFEDLSGSLRTRVARAASPPPESMFPTLLDAPAMRDAVAELDADAAFVYHFESLAASRTLDVPRFAAVGDPPQLSALYHFRRSLPSLRGLTRLQAQVRHQPRLLVRMLDECAACGAFAAHHARWLRSRGAARCAYLRTPVPDPGRVVREHGALPRILLVGHLKGAVTLEGVQRFAKHVLPRLEEALGPEGFEVHLAGGYDPPPQLARLLDRPSVRLLGHVDDIAAELRGAHVLLVPNSITLGIRVRIVTAFAHGTCVVSDRANALGIPELADGVNALVSSTPEGLADATLRALADADLRRRLGDGGRATYERWFQPPVSVGRIAETLEAIARPRQPARSR